MSYVKTLESKLKGNEFKCVCLTKQKIKIVKKINKMVDTEYPKLVHRDTGSVIHINANPFSLGRGLGCNYVMTNESISRRHCAIEKIGDSWILEDTSTNGTFVNGKLYVKVKSPPLGNGNTIAFDVSGSEYIFYLPESGQSDEMEDISDEQLCQLAESVLDEVEVFQRDNQNEDNMNIDPISSMHPLHDHLGMVKSQEAHLNKKLKRDTDTTHAVDVAMELQPINITSVAVNGAKSVPAEAGPSRGKEKEPPDETKINPQTASGPPKPPKQQAQENLEEMENELQCAICSEVFVKAVTLNCAHTFCKYCIELWKKTKSECPICRTKITSVIATLVLDNVIEKMMEGSAEDVKQHRKQLLAERVTLENARPAPASHNANVRGQGRGRRARQNVGVLIEQVIEVSSDSNSDSQASSDTDSNETSEWRDDYDNDDWLDGYYFDDYPNFF